MICGTDALQTRRNSTFVHIQSSSPSWPALVQGFRRAKKPRPLALRKHRRRMCMCIGLDSHKKLLFNLHIRCWGSEWLIHSTHTHTHTLTHMLPLPVAAWKINALSDVSLVWQSNPWGSEHLNEFLTACVVECVLMWSCGRLQRPVIKGSSL